MFHDSGVIRIVLRIGTNGSQDGQTPFKTDHSCLTLGGGEYQSSGADSRSGRGGGAWSGARAGACRQT